MMLGVPVFAAAAAWAMLGEELGPVQIAGGLLTLGAIGMVVRRSPAPPDARFETVPEPIVADV